MSSDEVLGADPQVVSAADMGDAGAVFAVAEAVANEPELTAGPETPEPEVNPTMAETAEEKPEETPEETVEQGVHLTPVARSGLLHTLGKWRARSNNGMVRRVERAARRLLKQQRDGEPPNADAAEILADENKFKAFIDHCVCSHLMECGVMNEEFAFTVGSDSMVGGPIGDALAKLLDSFINDPEKWLRVISMIISLFA